MRNRTLKRYLKGDYRFTVKGGFPDVFLKECGEEKAVLRNVLVNGSRVTGQADRRDQAAVLRAAGRAGMEIEKETRFGLRYTLDRYRARVGIPLGLVLAVLTVQFLSSVLWSVEVRGLSRINEEDFMRFLASSDVRKGVFLMRVDCNEIEEQIERYSAFVKRATVNLIGCRMYIDVQERDLPPEIDGRNRYCNVIAAKGGEVVKADIFAGVGSVKPGDILQPGDLIAAGVMELKNGGVRYLEAKANVTAKTVTEFTFQTALHGTVREAVKKKDRFALYFFGAVFPRIDTGNANVGWLSAGGTVFPAGILRQRETELAEEPYDPEFAAVRLLALDRVAVAAANELGGKKVLYCTVSLFSEDTYRVAARFVCEENIAQQQYFEVLE